MFTVNVIVYKQITHFTLNVAVKDIDLGEIIVCIKCLYQNLRINNQDFNWAVSEDFILSSVYRVLSSHQNKKASSPFYHRNYFYRKWGYITFMVYQKCFLWQNGQKAFLFWWGHFSRISDSSGKETSVLFVWKYMEVMTNYRAQWFVVIFVTAGYIQVS